MKKNKILNKKNEQKIKIIMYFYFKFMMFFLIFENFFLFIIYYLNK